jgi:D-glycero-D-manno-heptose 1,7-bisphosphate phosphatase
MSDLGLGLIVVTNQSGIGRGYFDQATLLLIHQRLKGLLRKHGVRLDGIYFCPHTPDDECRCRKPRTGLIHTAAEELGFAPQRSFVLGDKPCDIELGEAVGATTFLVRTGYGEQFADNRAVSPDYVVDDIDDASKVIARLLHVSPKATHGESRQNDH